VLMDSGRAYYTLIEELAHRGIEYTPLLPSDSIPLDIQIVITSESFKQLIRKRKRIVWKEDSDPREVVDQMVRQLHRKGGFKEVAIGIDPGKELGVAVVVDGKVLESRVFSNVREAVEEVRKHVLTLPSLRTVVRIGSGAEDCGKDILLALMSQLRSGVEVQRVEEWGTTNNKLPRASLRYSRNALAAVRIAFKQGQTVFRSALDVHNSGER